MDNLKENFLILLSIIKQSFTKSSGRQWQFAKNRSGNEIFNEDGLFINVLQ